MSVETLHDNTGIKTEIHIVEQDRLPNVTLVQELGEVAKLPMNEAEAEESQKTKAAEPIRRDFPKDNEEIVVIAKDSEGKPRAAAIAVVSNVIDGVSVKRFKAENPDDGAAVLEALEEVVSDKFAETGNKPTVHVTPFAEQNHEEIFDRKGSSGTHSYYGPGRMIKLR
jgi:hypothetical protein